MQWQNVVVGVPLVLIVGRETTDGKGIRTPGYSSGRLYCDAIARAGGVPVILPPIAELNPRVPDVLDRVHGVVLHGGGDLDPTLYGQNPATDQLYGVDPILDSVELAVTKAAIERDLPVLAICRGFQLLNVAQGGNLIQHIEDGSHRDVFHPVGVVSGSRVESAMGSNRPSRCHSFHHQAVANLGADLTITAVADDGVIEAIEHTDRRWVVGVQWHPEDTAAEDPEQQGLFDRFVIECGEPRRAPGTGA